MSCNIIYTIRVWYSDIPCQSFPHLPSPYSFGSTVQWFSSVRTMVQCIQAKYQTGTELPPNYTQTEPMVQFNLVWFQSGSRFEPVHIWTMTSLSTRFHSSKSGSYACAKPTNTLVKSSTISDLLSKLGRCPISISSHHPTMQPSAPNQYFLQCLGTSSLCSPQNARLCWVWGS